METATEALAKSSSLRKVSVKYLSNFMKLQRLHKKLEQGNTGSTFIQFYSNIADVYNKHKK